MPLILASLFSRKSMSAGLMIYDPESSGRIYVQLVDFSGLPVHVHQIRGISLVGDRLYALVPSVMLIFRISDRTTGPVLTLEKTICRPEWVLGGNQQGDLHAVYAGQDRQKVYLSFNSHCAIDVFDLEGNFLQRRHLWDISPDLFPLPCGSLDKNFRFGVVRHIFESEHKELMVTTALMNGKKDSAVISYDNGRKVLSLESQPLHGGLINKHTLYLCAIQKGEVQYFSWPHDQMAPDIEPVKQLFPKITDSSWKGSEQKTRGLAINNGRLFCGVCYPGKPKPRQIPPRMVEFDLQNGDQVREHWLPSFEGLEEPHIYALHPVSKELEQAVALRDTASFYRGEEPFEPIWVVRDAPAVRSKRAGGSETPETVGLENDSKPLPISDEGKSSPKVEKSSDNNPHSEVRDQNRNTSLYVEKDDSPSPFVAGDPSISVSLPPNPDINSQPMTYPPEPTVVFENVGLFFERSARKFLSFNKNLRHKKSFWALRDVSFTVREGETLGVIGRNGSGKSTLSMVCSGVLVPDRGKVMVCGRAQLLALGVGFKNELSGRDNVYICASLLGLSKKQIQKKMDDIEAFAELGEFMDEPVRTYSSGMRSRLGFAVATAVKPDILILDEIMATGDKAFQDKAMRRMREMRNLARSVIVVSHNPGQLRKLATKVLWLDKGRMVMLGEPREVLNAYDNFCQNPAKWLENHPDLVTPAAREDYPNG